MDATVTALQKIGIKKPTWKTVIVTASQEVEMPAALLWETWSYLERWPHWSTPLHVATRWIGKPGWKVGATFEQVLNLGFPVGKLTSAETVSEIVPGEYVLWWKNEKGIKSCHIWQFERLSGNPNSITRITDVEVFHGTMMGLVKPLVSRRWHQMFEHSVAGLIRQAQLQTAVTLT